MSPARPVRFVSPAMARPSRVRTLLLALSITVAGLVAYLPSLPGEFIWDDDAHVTHNATLRDLDGLVDIWVPRVSPRYEPNTPQYYPLSFSALWLQFQFFGVDPLGYRVVNLALHLANALLVWALFARLGMRGAWLLGALFALHPMHVETTAWTMEIKNLLSAFFYLLAAIAYLRFDERWSAAPKEAPASFPFGAWALATALFTCALLAKSITCTLPAALILALLFRRERLDRRRLMPLAPLFVLGIGLALNTAWLEHNHVGAQGDAFVYSAAERALIAARVLLFYPYKLLVPWPNLFVYPRWPIDPGSLLAWWPVAAVLALAGGALAAYLRGWRGPALALAFYAGSILPATGIVTYYPMLFSFVADHFCYLASLGILALLAAGLTHGLRAASVRSTVALVLLVGLGTLTAFQSANFATAEALYRHTLAHNPDAWLARSQLAQVLLPGGQPWKKDASMVPDPARLREAEELLRGAIALKEDHEIQHYNLALCLLHQGRAEEARPHARRAVELSPLDPELVSVAGVIEFLTGDHAAAEALARQALALDARNYKALQLVADCELERGEGARARRGFVLALQVAPNAEARGLTIQKLIQTLTSTTPAQALELLDQLALDLGGLPIDLARVRASALAGAGRFDDAIREVAALLAQARSSADAERADSLERQLELLRQAAAHAQ